MDTFSALADPTRRHILEMLAQKGSLPASEISQKFHISAPAISQHLKVLKDAKLVDMEKKAQQRIYSVNTHAVLELEKWAKEIQQRWEGRLNSLDKILAIEKKKMEK